MIAGLATLPAAGQSTAPGARASLTATASGPVTRRGQIRDTAVLAGGLGPTGAISFSVYGPADPGCTSYPLATWSAAVTGDGTYFSVAYTAPTAGVYRFVAGYGGDAANAAVTTSCRDPAQAVTVSNPPPPVLGRSFQVGPLSGAVYVMVAPAVTRTGTRAAAAAAAAKGIGFERLAESRTLPVGSVIDATAGVARITSAAGGPGQVQTGDFAAGDFAVLQSRREHGLTELVLMVGRAGAIGCPAAGAGTRARAAVGRRLSAHVLGQLRARVAGRFRTRGRFSSATVRGTSWDTIERCDGTLTRVTRGVVVVTDLRRARSIVLLAGRSYLARAA